jgi:hypothetical protein
VTVLVSPLVTVAVRVTELPKVEGFGELASVIVGVIPLTVCVIALEVAEL